MMRHGARPSSAKMLVLGALLLSAACGGDGGPSMPSELQMRNEEPYIAGRITSRETLAGDTVRLLVTSEDPDARVAAAVVTVPGGADVYWSDWRGARSSDLVASRRVTVWVTGPELRSLPPQVTARLIVARD